MPATAFGIGGRSRTAGASCHPRGDPHTRLALKYSMGVATPQNARERHMPYSSSSRYICGDTYTLSYGIRDTLFFFNRDSTYPDVSFPGVVGGDGHGWSDGIWAYGIAISYPR